MPENTTILSIINGISLPISKLADAPDISAADLFAVEQNDCQNADEVVVQLVNGLGYELSDIPDDTIQGMREAVDSYVHANFKVRYDQLSCRLLHDISAAFDFKSMAYRESWEHARVTHNHTGEYNYVRCKAAFSKAQVVAQGAQDHENVEDMPEWIGTMKIWSLSGDQYLPTSTDFFMPHFKINAYDEPDIGEVRFMAWTQFPNASSKPYCEKQMCGTEMVYDMETSGYWIYPHGQTLTCQPDEFPYACQVFAGNSKATSFTVKNLSGFMRLNPAEEKDDPCKVVPWSNGFLKEHTHELIADLTSSSTQQITATATFSCGRSGGKGDYLHNGNGKPIPVNLKIFGDTTIEAKINLADSEMASYDIETKPAAIKLPVMMYIGRHKNDLSLQTIDEEERTADVE